MKTGLDRSDEKAYRKAYYQANKEKQKAYALAYYQANKDKCTALNKAWRALNPERVKKIKATYQQNNQALSNQRHSKWRANLRATNPEKYKAMKKADYIKYKDSYDAANRKACANRVRDLPDLYVKYIILWNSDSSIEIPQALIEAKRLQILIKRRLKDEQIRKEDSMGKNTQQIMD